jgi:two-component system chemotaxis response regulator CheB
LKRIRVLVVDDSAFARKVLRHALAGSPTIEVVGTAHDGLDALERIAELQPDVVTLDLVMPNLDGIGLLQALKKLNSPTSPRVIVVSMSASDSDLALTALREGAVDIVHKPTALANDRLYELSAELREKVEAVAAARTVTGYLGLAAPAVAAKVSGRALRHGLVLIGASTGGPQAVSALLRALPKDFPLPIAVVVHMPVGFSQSLAEHLDRDCTLSVREASGDEPLRAGEVVVARAGMHLNFKHTSDGYRTQLSSSPKEGLHRPSVDVMFRSAAEVSSQPVLGVVLTGMGSDGLEGARVIKQRGGCLLTQSEASCVVYGMPRVIWEEGIASGQATIEALPALIMAHL